MQRGDRAKALGGTWLSAWVGVFIVATPYLTETTRPIPFWNSLFVGLMVLGIAVWNVVAVKAGRRDIVVGTMTFHLVAGLWLIAVPFLFATNADYRMATVIEGLVLIATSGFIAWAVGRLRGPSVRRTI